MNCNTSVKISGSRPSAKPRLSKYRSGSDGRLCIDGPWYEWVYTILNTLRTGSFNP